MTGYLSCPPNKTAVSTAIAHGRTAIAPPALGPERKCLRNRSHHTKVVLGYFRPLRLEISEPTQGAHAWKEAVLTAARNNELRQTFESHSDWPPGHIECSVAIARAGNWIRPRSSSEESTIVHPLGLHELELSAQMGANESEHQSTVHAVVFEDALRQLGTI